MTKPIEGPPFPEPPKDAGAKERQLADNLIQDLGNFRDGVEQIMRNPHQADNEHVLETVAKQLKALNDSSHQAATLGG